METALAWIPTSEFTRTLDAMAGRHERCRLFAAMTRVNTLYMISRAGSGHLGSSFSAADIVSWLLLAEMREPFRPDGDLYFSSKGHDVPGLYAALIGLGMLDEDLLHRLRRIDGLPGHPDVRTPLMPFNTGSLGMGISKAKGLVLGNRLAGRRQRVYVLTGDGELQEGQNWEALAGAVRHGMDELTVIVDHNKLQSDTWVRDVSDLGDLEAKFGAFGWGVVRCDGHDYGELEAAFRRRHESFAGGPAVVIADTVKGAGCDTFAATSMASGEWRYRHHSGAPNADDYHRAHGELMTAVEELSRELCGTGVSQLTTTVSVAPATSAARLPEVYGEVLASRAADNPHVVVLDADLLIDTGVLGFAEAYPDRFFECGIAEQDMVSMAGGLAAGGALPFVHSFSCFLHSRPNEQIYNNASEGRRVVYVGSLAGLVPAAPGHSHQAVRDVSALAAVPGLVMLEPASPAEVGAAVDYCLTAQDSVYLRLSSAPCPDEVVGLPAPSLVPGRGLVVRQGGPAVVAIGAGPVILAQLLRAADSLRDRGVDLTIVDLPWLNRVDNQWLEELVEGSDLLVVVEGHYVRGGQADLIARGLLELESKRLPTFVGIGLEELPHCGTPAEVLAAHRLDANSLTERILAAAREMSAATNTVRA